MKIPPLYSVTPEMLALIAKIESNLLYIASLNFPKPLKDKIQRVSLLKSSLFSARIEGNPLELSDVQSGDKKSQKKLEIFNILQALQFIEKKLQKGKINNELLLRLHKYVLKNLSPDAGKFRLEPSAIFNQAGEAV